MLRSLSFAGLCVGLVLSGCGGEAKRLPTVKAGGKVIYEGSGRPVTNLEVVLLPVAGGDYSPHGKLDAEGKFQLSTYGENDGAPVGTYKAYFRAAMPELPKGPPGAAGPPKGAVQPPVVKVETVVPKEYTTPEKTPLTTVEITEGGPELTLTIKRPTAK